MSFSSTTFLSKAQRGVWYHCRNIITFVFCLGYKVMVPQGLVWMQLSLADFGDDVDDTDSGTYWVRLQYERETRLWGKSLWEPFLALLLNGK